MCIMLKVDTCTTYGFLDIEANVKMLTDKQDIQTDGRINI